MRDAFMMTATSEPRRALLHATIVNSFLNTRTRNPALIVWLIVSVSPSSVQALEPSETFPFLPTPNQWNTTGPIRGAAFSSADKTISPGIGELAFAGYPPSVGITDHKTILPGLGELTLAGFAPTVAVAPVGGDKTLAPNAGTLTITGFTPVVWVYTKYVRRRMMTGVGR